MASYFGFVGGLGANVDQSLQKLFAAGGVGSDVLAGMFDVKVVHDAIVSDFQYVHKFYGQMYSMVLEVSGRSLTAACGGIDWMACRHELLQAHNNALVKSLLGNKGYTNLSPLSLSVDSMLKTAAEVHRDGGGLDRLIPEKTISEVSQARDLGVAQATRGMHSREISKMKLPKFPSRPPLYPPV